MQHLTSVALHLKCDSADDIPFVEVKSQTQVGEAQDTDEPRRMHNLIFREEARCILLQLFETMVLKKNKVEKDWPL